MKKIALLALLLTLVSSTFAKRKPPVTIAISGPQDAIKAATVAEAVSDGWTIESEGQFQIVFTKPMNTVGGMFTSALLSPTACSGIRPRYLFTLIFVPDANGVNLTTHKEMEHADGFCHPARDNWDDQNRKYAEAFLGKIKSTIEAGNTPANEAKNAPLGSTTVPPVPPKQDNTSSVPSIVPTDTKKEVKKESPTIKKADDCADDPRPYSLLDCHGRMKARN